MNSTGRAVPGQPGPSPVRAEASAKRKLGYQFDAIPKFVADLIVEGKLKPTDELVVKHLLRFRKRIVDSCWTTKRILAKATGLSLRTVQRSLGRLSDAAVIEQRPVAIPDPDEPANRTGWRIAFLWMAPEGYVPGPGPHRPGRGTKKERHADCYLGDTRVSPKTVSPETPVSPGGETPVSPKYNPSGLDGNLNQTETTPSSSSNSRGDDDGRRRLVSPPGEKSPEGTETFTDAIEAVMACFGAKVSDIVKADAPRIAKRINGRWDCFAPAAYQARRMGAKVGEGRRIGYLIAVANDFAANGVSAEAIAYRDKLHDDHHNATLAKLADERRVAEEAAKRAEADDRIRSENMALPVGELVDQIENAYICDALLTEGGDKIRFAGRRANGVAATFAGLPLTDQHGLVEAITARRLEIIEFIKSRGAESRPFSAIKVGCSVSHPKYGIGEVLHVERQDGPLARACVTFPGVGRLDFKLAYASLTPVAD